MASYHDIADDELREKVKTIRDTSGSYGEIRQRVADELGLPTSSITVGYTIINSSKVTTVRFQNSKGKPLQI